jgi:valyl-tRNA synthetase
MNLDTRRLEGARNFTNKIWQATRFILMNLEDAEAPSLREVDESCLTLEDRWILSRINGLTGNVTRLMDAYQYGEAGRQVRDFLWDEFCDWYIEATKVRLYTDGADKETPRAILPAVLEQAMRLLHPYMPFVTEAIWQALPEKVKQGPALMMAPWPEQDAARLDEDAEAQMALLMDLIRGIRGVRSDYNVQPGRRIAATIAAGGASSAIEESRDILTFLARMDGDQLEIVERTEPLDQSASVVVGDLVAYLPLAGLVDLEAERARLEKELANLNERIADSEERLAGPFAEKAPEHIVQRERDKLAGMRTEAAQVEEQIERLRG